MGRKADGRAGGQAGKLVGQWDKWAGRQTNRQRAYDMITIFNKQHILDTNAGKQLSEAALNV
jgi:hypothetical protein